MNSIRGQLILFFLALIVLPMGVTLWSFGQAFERSAEGFVAQVAANLQVQSSSQIASIVSNAQRAVEYQNDILKVASVKFDASAEQQQALRENLKANIVNMADLRNIGLVNLADSHFYMASRDAEGRPVVKEVRAVDDRREERYWLDQQKTTPWVVSAYRAEERPWYRAATEQEGSTDFERVWTLPYVFSDSHDTGLTTAKAINAPGEGYRPPFAVAFADVSLQGFADVLAELNVGRDGYVVLADSAGRVLASSLGSVPVESGNLLSVSVAGKEFIDEASWQALRKPQPQLDGRPLLQEYRFGNADYYAMALPLNDSNLAQFDWNLWVFVQKAPLLADFYRSRLQVYLFSAVVAAVALMLALMIWSRIGMQLGSVIRAFGRVQEGDFRTPLAITRAYREVAELIRHFNGMLKALRENTLMQRLISKSALQDITQHAEVHGEAGLLAKSERVNRVLLFSDIRGFTSFSEKREPEEVVAMLNEVLGLHTTVIHEMGGDIDKYVGDEVVATFDGEGSELQAVKAAIEICRRMQDRGAAYGLNVGIGINGGAVVSGYIGCEGRAQFTSIGSNVNYAARLCGKAGPGEIWVSQIIYEKCKDSIAFKPLGGIDFKGYSEPQQVYLATC